MSGWSQYEARVLATQAAAQKGEDVAMLLGAGTEHGHEDGLGLGAGWRATAAPHLAVDHSRADGLLGPPVGGVESGMMQKGEQLIAVPGQMLGQSFVGRIRARPSQQPITSALQTTTGDGYAASADLARLTPIAKIEGV